mgnify:FL=1
MADAQDLKSCGGFNLRAGSSPASGTIFEMSHLKVDINQFDTSFYLSYAGVAELADARDSKSRVPLGRVGSTPTTGIKNA